MCDLLVNDVFDELKEENQRLETELSFDRELIQILENIKNYSMILKTNCNCSENIEIFKKLNDFEIDYKILKSKEKTTKRGLIPNTGIQISNIKSVNGLKDGLEVSAKSRSTKDMTSEQICKECHQKFASELDLVLHINRHHKEIESFVCHECKEVFTKRDVFSSHLLDHQTNGESSQSDQRSKLKPRTITDYLRSYRRPNPTENESETTLMETIKSENNMRLITEMLKSRADGTTDDNNVLAIKGETSYEAFGDFRCTECQKNFNSSESLELHIKSSHPCLVCSKCNTSFNTKEEVFSHLSTHHKVPAQFFCCFSCNFKTSSKYCYDRHIQNRVCSKGHYRCTNTGCTATFNRTETLRRHRKGCQKKAKGGPRTAQKKTNAEQFVCNVCQFVTKSNFNLIRHQNCHSTDRPFKCDINGCQYNYKKKNHLRDHQRRVHKEIFPMSLLKSLNKNIRNVSKLDFSQELKETNEVQPNDELIVSTSIEDRIKLEFISDSDNESSILKNSTERPELESGVNNNQKLIAEKYSCKSCHFTTSNKLFLTLHEIQEHPEMRPHKCQFPKCGKVYTRADTLAKHQKAVHAMPNSEVSTPLPTVKVSTNGKLFECDVCHYKTEFVQLLRRHMTIHSPDKPFKCGVDGCEYASNRRDTLKNHQKAVHKVNARQFACNYPNCRRRFDSTLLLKQHMSSHKNRFVCRWEGCQYRTDTFAKLNEHRRSENHMPPQLT